MSSDFQRAPSLAPAARVIRSHYGVVIGDRDMARVNAQLGRIAARDGLAVALLVAWQHGLTIGHIPVDDHANAQLLAVPASAHCPYVFVHVPVRTIRGDHSELIRRGIMNPQPDPTRLRRHDPVRSRHHDSEGVPDSWVTSELLRTRRGSGEAHADAATGACFLCSEAELTPHEASFGIPADSAHAPTARDYAVGFTFAPFGDPAEVCHFLAWDHPGNDAPVLSMQPTDFSTTDLLTITSRVNDGLAQFCQDYQLGAPPTITGVCNHWAGNTIDHQHYQFFSLSTLPLLVAAREPGSVITIGQGLRVRRVTSWPAAAYVIEPMPGDDGVWDAHDPDPQVRPMVGRAADALAALWNDLAASHTQNTVAYRCEGTDRALVIPRDRNRTATLPTLTGLRKVNAGVLEMLGYFLIDDAVDLQRIAGLGSAQRTALGDAWLAALTPPAAEIAEFEAEVRAAPLAFTS